MHKFSRQLSFLIFLAVITVGLSGCTDTSEEAPINFQDTVIDLDNFSTLTEKAEMSASFRQEMVGDKIDDILLSETKEITRDVDTSDLQTYTNDGGQFSFKYPTDLHLVESEPFTTNNTKAIQKFRDKYDISFGYVTALFHFDLRNDDDKKIGFIRGGVIKPFQKLINMSYLQDRSLGVGTWVLVDGPMIGASPEFRQRKNDSKNESIGYIRSPQQKIFPWTVIDVGYGEIYSMSYIFEYDESSDTAYDIEIRLFGYDKEYKDILYGILKTLEFSEG